MAKFLAELQRLVRLSLPVALTQLGLMATGLVDTLMVSRLGVLELAGLALANMWQWTWMVGGLGMGMAIDPLISQAHGRGAGDEAALALQRGVVIAVLISLPIGALVALTGPCLIALGQPPDVAQVAAAYNLYKLPTIPCFLVYSSLRQYLQGRTLVAPAAWVMWGGNLVNVGLNWILIFGHWGMPALGIVGAAVASSITMGLWLAGLWAWTLGFRLHRGAWRPWSLAAVQPAGLRQVLRLGAPIAFQMTLESTAFSIATLMAGWLSTQAVASHHVVFSLAAASFMIPLGVSQGAAVRVGNLIGAGDEAGMRRAAGASLLLGALVMLGSLLIFTLLRHDLPKLFLDDPLLISMAAAVLPIVGAFQLSDGTQVVAAGVLRGMGRPIAAALTNLVGYYGIALPLAYVCAFRLGWGLVGLWSALALGLTVVAVTLVFWVRRTARLPLSVLRVQVEGGVGG